MGEAGHKVFLLLGIALQISHFLLNGAGHGIEAQRQIAYLIQRFHLCPLLVLTGGNAVGGTIQCADPSFDLKEGVRLCYRETEGVMVFELSHIINNDCWNSIKEGIEAAKADLSEK